jgi:hypothetical protein
MAFAVVPDPAGTVVEENRDVTRERAFDTGGVGRDGFSQHGAGLPGDGTIDTVAAQCPPIPGCCLAPAAC